MWHVYILQASTGRLYVGLTGDIKRRLQEHSSGKSHYASYNHNPILIYSESFDSQTEARKRETQLKGWTRAKKLALVSGDRDLLKQL